MPNWKPVVEVEPPAFMGAPLNARTMVVVSNTNGSSVLFNVDLDYSDEPNRMQIFWRKVKASVSVAWETFKALGEKNELLSDFD